MEIDNINKTVVDSLSDNLNDLMIESLPITPMNQMQKQLPLGCSAATEIISIGNDFFEDNIARDVEISHYTRLSTLSILLNPKKDFRLYNAEYLNDPKEGQVFTEILLKKLRDKCTELSIQFKDTQYISRIIEHYVHIKEKVSNVYIISFCKESDSLPMWSMYGDDGNGLSLTVSAKQFDNSEMSTSGEDYEKLWYLLKVNYIEKNGDGAYDLASPQNNLYENIVDKIFELEECTFLESDLSQILEMIDKLRFLFKDASYKHEQECRMIIHQEKQDFDYDELDANSDIRLYINLDKKLDYSKITVGPKCTELNKIRQLVLHSHSNAQVVKSRIEYQ